jgi:pimeloyl-ACP methyl ester carboxylesterase
VFVSSGNAQIAYDVVGHGGQDVLLVHAGVCDRHSWGPVIDRLRPRHRCAAFDQRRFGDTTYETDHGWSPVADALAVMDAAGMSRAVMVACSMGGKRALDLTLAHPDRVAGLVLIGSAVRGAPSPQLDPHGSLAQLVKELEDAEARGDLNVALRLEAHIWLDGPTASEGRVGGEVRARFNAANRRAAESPDTGPEAELPDVWPRLHEITAPTLVLTGRLDVENLVAMNPLIADRIPGAEFKWLDGVAHLPHMEGNETTLSAISEFVDSVAAIEEDSFGLH